MPYIDLVGEDDPITPPEFNDTIAAHIGDNLISYRKFANCGHGVVRDRPEEAMAEFRIFILSNPDWPTRSNVRIVALLRPPLLEASAKPDDQEQKVRLSSKSSQ